MSPPPTPLDLNSAYDDAKLLEQLSYDTLVVKETKDDPFAILALAAQAITTLKLSTAVSIAFPRSPTVMAMCAWTIRKLSKGRFTLGLSPQIRGHIQRRFGMQ